MLKDEEIRRDSEAIKIKTALEHWQKVNPGQSPEDSFWKNIQILRGRYSLTVLSRFFGLDYHRMQRGLSKGWRISQNDHRYEFAELRQSKDEVSLMPIPAKASPEIAASIGNSLILELMLGTSKVLRIRYEQGQGKILKEVLEVFS